MNARPLTFVCLPAVLVGAFVGCRNEPALRSDQIIKMQTADPYRKQIYSLFATDVIYEYLTPIHSPHYGASHAYRVDVYFGGRYWLAFKRQYPSLASFDGSLNAVQKIQNAEGGSLTTTFCWSRQISEQELQLFLGSGGDVESLGAPKLPPLHRFDEFVKSGKPAFGMQNGAIIAEEF